MINIAEILENYPRGTKLYSPIFGDVYLESVRPHISVVVTLVKGEKDLTEFLYDGRYGMNGECMLFPSKENRDWSTFQIPFKDGDIVFYNNTIAMFKEWGDDTLFRTYCVFYPNVSDIFSFEVDRPLFGKGVRKEIRLATEDEKKMLFDAIKTKGYKWNVETKTLEKVIECKFKVGDKIVEKDNPFKCWYVQGIDTYCNSDFYYIVTKGQVSNLHFKDQDGWELAPVPKFKVGDIVETKRNKLFDYKIIKITDTHYTLESIPGANTYDILICEDENWKLVPNKFDISTLKAYDKVLVRDGNDETWVNAFFGFYDNVTNKKYPFVASAVNWAQCIPYEGNEHLLGTCDDCDEYYKNW